MENDLLVEENNVVTLTYELRNESATGKSLEQMDARYPFIFLFGGKKLLPAFEDQLRGLKEGDTFEFTLTPDEGYGQRMIENVLELPVGNFEHGMLIEGNYVMMTDDNTGEKFNGKILSWNEEMAKVDFNHAMAGRNLHFKGVVLTIRKATVEELIQGHYIAGDGSHYNRGTSW